MEERGWLSELLIKSMMMGLRGLSWFCWRRWLMRLILGRVAEEVMMASNCWEIGADPRGVVKGKIDQEEWFLKKRVKA